MSSQLVQQQKCPQGRKTLPTCANNCANLCKYFFFQPVQIVCATLSTREMNTQFVFCVWKQKCMLTLNPEWLFTSWAWQMTHSSLSSATLKQIWIMQSLRLPRLLISRLFVYLFVCLFDCLLVCLFVCLFVCFFLSLYVFVCFFITSASPLTPFSSPAPAQVWPPCLSSLWFPSPKKRVYSWHPFYPHHLK